MPIILH